MTCPVWIFMTDERCGRLVRVLPAYRSPGNSMVLEEIHNDHTEYGIAHELSNATDAASPSRFAAEVSVWLERQFDRFGIDQLLVAAPSNFLRVLRTTWPPRLAVRIRELGEDVFALRLSDLSTDPRIQSCADW